MISEITDLDRILVAAGDVIINDGYDAVSLERIAQRADADADRIDAMFPSVGDILVSMLNREFAAMYRGIVDHIERDEKGGLLSRIYLYTLSTIYERPLAKTLFVIDRDALNAIMRHSHSFSYVPQIGVRAEMIERLQRVGGWSLGHDAPACCRGGRIASQHIRALTVDHSKAAGLPLQHPVDDFVLGHYCT